MVPLHHHVIGAIGCEDQWYTSWLKQIVVQGDSLLPFYKGIGQGQPSSLYHFAKCFLYLLDGCLFDPLPYKHEIRRYYQCARCRERFTTDHIRCRFYPLLRWSVYSCI